MSRKDLEHQQVPSVPEQDHWQQVLEENGSALYYDARSPQERPYPRHRARLTQLQGSDQVIVDMHITLVLPIERVGGKLGVCGFQRESWYAPKPAHAVKEGQR